MLTLVNIAEHDEIVDGGRSNRTNKNLSKSQTQKISTVLSYIGANIKNREFLIFKASINFTQLRHTFSKASMLLHFDLKCHIRIQTNVSGYIMAEMPS